MGNKSHWLAGSFSFCLPGLGQLYGRRFAKAVFFFLLFLGIESVASLHFWVPLYCLLAAVEAFKFSHKIITNQWRNYLYASVAVTAFMFWFFGFAPKLIPVAYGSELAMACPDTLARVVVQRENAVHGVKYERFMAASIVHTLGLSFFTGMAMANASSGRYTMPMFLLGGAMAALEVVPIMRYFIQKDAALRSYHTAFQALKQSSRLLANKPVERAVPPMALVEAKPEPRPEEIIQLPVDTNLNEDLWQIVALHRDFVVGANSDTVEKTSRRMVEALAAQLYIKHNLNPELLLQKVKTLAPDVNYQGFLTPQ